MRFSAVNYYYGARYCNTQLSVDPLGAQRVATSMIPDAWAPEVINGGETPEEPEAEPDPLEDPIKGSSLASDDVLVDLERTLQCLIGDLELEINWDGVLTPQTIGSITFANCDGDASSDEYDAGAPGYVNDPECECEQSIYWANLAGHQCNQYNIMYWYHPDYLGSVEFVTDNNGAPYQFFFNTPFGENLENQFVDNYRNFESRFRFNGKEWDEETGNYYYGARYYDPKISVWLSVDPKASKYPSLSPYVFVANNPVMLIDPNGMEIDWGANFFGALRAKVSSMMTKRGRVHWNTMKNDQTTLYSFDYSKSAAVGQRSDDSYGFVEGLNETSDAPNQDGMYESKTTIFTGSHKVEKDARQSAGVDNLDDLSAQDKSTRLNEAINNSNRSVYNIDDGTTQKGGGFNFTFGNNPNKPRPLNNETSREFNHRILIHESTHGLMMGGNRFWNNSKRNTHPEAIPWFFEQQGIDQMRKNRR